MTIAAANNLYEVFLSKDGGANWDLIAAGDSALVPDAKYKDFYSSIVCSGDGKTLAVIGHDYGVNSNKAYGIYTSLDGGDTWSRFPKVTVGPEGDRAGSTFETHDMTKHPGPVALTLSEDGKQLAVALKSGPVWTSVKSSSAGGFTEWTERGASGSQSIASSGDGKMIALCCSDWDKYFSFDYGSTWTTAPPQSPDGTSVPGATHVNTKSIVSTRDGKIALATDKGVWVYA